MERQTSRLLGLSGLIALVAGGAISVLAFLVARYGPAADGWSFKGNGALAVYPVLLAVLTAGWTALVLHARRHPRWLQLGLAAGAVGLVLALAAAAMLPLFGTGADQAVTPAIYIALLVWMIAAPVWAARSRAKAGAAVGAGRHLAAGAAWLVAAIAGLWIVGVIIPAGS